MPQIAAAVGALLCSAALYVFVFRTGPGRALRAVSQDRVAALTMGIDADRMNALAWGLASACVGVAGSLLSNFYYVFPRVGAVFVLVAYVTVALGGFGSISGALVAGVIIGVLQVLSGFFLDVHAEIRAGLPALSRGRAASAKGTAGAPMSNANHPHSAPVDSSFPAVVLRSSPCWPSCRSC